MADLRSALEEAMSQAESGELEAPVEKKIEIEETPRNEKGQFYHFRNFNGFRFSIESSNLG